MQNNFTKWRFSYRISFPLWYEKKFPISNHKSKREYLQEPKTRTFWRFAVISKGGRRKRSYWPCKSKSSSTCKMVSHFIHPLTSSLPFMLPFSHISIVNVGGNASPTLIFCCQNHCEAGVRPPPFFARWPPVPLPLFHPLLGLLRRVRVKVWMRDSDWENRAGGGNSPFKRIVMECATQGSRVGLVSIEGWTMISLVKCIQAELKFG